MEWKKQEEILIKMAICGRQNVSVPAHPQGAGVSFRFK
jgi:hypothetical protein